MGTQERESVVKEPRRRGPARLASLRPLTSEPDIHPIRETDASLSVAQRDLRYRRSLAVGDALSALVALAVSIAGFEHANVSIAALLGVPLVILASKLHGLYDRDELVIHKTTMEEAPALLQLAAVYTLVTWMFDDFLIGASMGSVRAAVLWASLWTFALAFRRIARWAASRSVAPERLLLVGDAATYERLAHKLEANGVNANLVARISMERVANARPAQRAVDEPTVRSLLTQMNVERVLVVPSQTSSEVTLDLVRTVKALGVRVSIVPDILEVVGNSVVFDDLGGMTVLGVRRFELSRSSRIVKRGFDLVGAVLGLIVLAPVFAAIALAIKLDSRGPVFFRQERVGRDGRRFRIFKFRTMVADAEARKVDVLHLNEAEGLFKVTDDPRITRAGRLLRSSSLDELAQLLNVVKGEMSLVGPRPLISAEDETITGYDRLRLHLTPGMTGHWQIMGSARVPMQEMVKIDYLYVATWTLFEDLKILVRTLPYMLARRGM
jgi:exopolysaccharide biosynthesis polyprenyl glycosylphosphotransferase